MHCSLINPHQIRAFGHSLCDDPWEPHPSLGLDVGSMFIPVASAGPNLYFETRVPTDWELDGLPLFDLTSPRWDSYDMLTLPTATQSDNGRLINAVHTMCKSATLLSTISSSLNGCCLNSLYSSAISVPAAATGTSTNPCGSCVNDSCNAFHFCNRLQITATVTGERHLSVTPENLACMWNIGIETAKKTLQ